MRYLAPLLALLLTLGACSTTPRDDARQTTASSDEPSSDAGSRRRADVVVAAMSALGTPYRYGGSSYQSGFDCSGFVQTMYQQTMDVSLPRQAADQAEATRRIGKQSLQPGDLVFFNTQRRPYSHVGIYIGDHRFIHSPKSGARVRIEDMRVRYWQQRFNGARRVDAPAVATR